MLTCLLRDVKAAPQYNLWWIKVKWHKVMLTYLLRDATAAPEFIFW